jgi:hypothetical protein
MQVHDKTFQKSDVFHQDSIYGDPYMSFWSARREEHNGVIQKNANTKLDHTLDRTRPHGPLRTEKHNEDIILMWWNMKMFMSKPPKDDKIGASVTKHN